MKSRFDVGFSNLDRQYLDTLHFNLFGREITNRGCSDCYRDAFIQISYELKKSGLMSTKPKCDYRLKAGVIIQFFGESQIYSNANLTNEAAERYLSLNPDNAKLFSELPTDWVDRAAETAAKLAEEEDKYANARTLEQARHTIDGYTEEVEALKSAVAAKDTEILNLNTRIAELQCNAMMAGEEEQEEGPSESELALENTIAELGEANRLLEAKTAEVETLKEEIANLKNENRALKAANTRLKGKGASATETPTEEAPAEAE